VVVVASCRAEGELHVDEGASYLVAVVEIVVVAEDSVREVVAVIVVVEVVSGEDSVRGGVVHHGAGAGRYDDDVTWLGVEAYNGVKILTTVSRDELQVLKTHHTSAQHTNIIHVRGVPFMLANHYLRLLDAIDISLNGQSAIIDQFL